MVKKILSKIGLYKTKYQKTKQEILKKLNSSNLSDVEEWLEDKIRNNEFNELDAYRIMFSLLKDKNLKKAIEYGERAQKIEFSKNIEKVLKARKKKLQKQEYSVAEFKSFFETHSIDEAREWIDKAVIRHPELKLPLYKAFFQLAKDKAPLIAIRYGEIAVQLGADKKFKKVLDARKKLLREDLDIDLSSLSLKELKAKIDELLAVDVKKAIYYAQEFQKIDRNLEVELKKYLIRKINKTHFQETVDLAWSIVDYLDEPSLLKVVAARAYALPDYEKALVLYEKYFCLSRDTSIFDRLLTCYTKVLSIVDIDKDLQEQIIKYKILFDLFFDSKEYEKAIKYGKEIVKIDRDTQYPIKLARAFFELGRISDALKYSNLNKGIESHKKIIEVYESYLRLKENGYPIVKKKAEVKNDNVLYVINNSLPYHSNGYSTRAHGLLKGAKKYKNIHALTRLGYPHDLAKFKHSPKEYKHIIDGVEYYRLLSDEFRLNHIALDKYLDEYAKRVAEHAKEQNIGLIHSASNFVNGLAANKAAAMLGLKSIYEVRGLWEVTRISRQPEWEGSEYYNMVVKLETQAANSADMVLTITEALRKELINRGVKKEIYVLPNGVDTKTFVPLKKDEKLKKELNLKDEVVIGYVGSILDYEGIDLLVEAISLLLKKGVKNFKFLLVGDGSYMPKIKELIKILGIERYVILTGRVPFEEVERYYSLIDIAPLPRKSLPVCEMVSPLKPFEAMAMQKVVLGSDVAAIAEIIDDGYNGMLFRKDDVEDLANRLQRLIIDKELREKIGKNAREWVVKYRDWEVLGKKLDSFYEELK